MAERLSNHSRNLGRKIGAPLLGLGILLSGPEQHADALVDYSLPAFDHTWSADDHSILASIHYDQNAVGYFVEDNGLPKPFLTALNSSLQNPAVSAAMREGDVKNLIVQKSEIDDGQWDHNVSDVKLMVSDGSGPIESRLFFDKRVLTATMVHETAHADSEKWYKYVRGGVSAAVPPSDLKTDIDEVLDTKRELDRVYFSQFPEPCIELGQIQMKCSDERAQRYDDEMYECIDEGHALQSLLQLSRPVPLGHPRHGVGEPLASAVASIEMNPSYVIDCFNRNPSKFNTVLRQLTKQILKLTFKTSPELEQALRRSDVKNDVINQLTA